MSRKTPKKAARRPRKPRKPAEATALPPEPPAPPLEVPTAPTPEDPIPPLPRGRGRPPVWEHDPEAWPRFVAALRQGNTMQGASAYAGVPLRTVYHALKEGRKDRREGRADTFHAGFLHEVEKALAVAEVFHVHLITTAARAGAWKASAFILSARHPERWAPASRVAALDRTFKKDAVFEMELPPRYSERKAAQPPEETP